MTTTQYYYFTEQPYTGYDPAVQEEYPALRLTLPNSLYDAKLASELYNRYHDEYQVADEAGFDGIMINEHHTAPFCMQASINITGTVLAKITRRAKIIMLGNPLPIVDNPLRLAEELDRKSTRLNSSHVRISYAVFCLKKKRPRSET